MRARPLAASCPSGSSTAAATAAEGLTVDPRTPASWAACDLVEPHQRLAARLLPLHQQRPSRPRPAGSSPTSWTGCPRSTCTATPTSSSTRHQPRARPQRLRRLHARQGRDRPGAARQLAADRGAREGLEPRRDELRRPGPARLPRRAEGRPAAHGDAGSRDPGAPVVPLGPRARVAAGARVDRPGAAPERRLRRRRDALHRARRLRA